MSRYRRPACTHDKAHRIRGAEPSLLSLSLSLSLDGVVAGVDSRVETRDARATQYRRTSQCTRRWHSGRGWAPGVAVLRKRETRGGVTSTGSSMRHTLKGRVSASGHLFSRDT